MTRSERLAERLLEPLNPSLIVIFGVYTVVWGLWILCPFWDVFVAAPLYATMAGIGSEYIWGTIATACGLIICRGALKPSYRNIQLGALVGFFHWLVIATLYFMGDWTSTGGITSATFALYSAIVWVNIKVNKARYLS